MPPLTSKAQMVRAILLASATDTTFTGRLCSMVRTQSGTFKPLLASLMIEVAPTIKSVRSCRFPRFDIAPSLSFPPLDRALGVSPVQAAKSRAVAKPRGSKTDVRTVAAMRTDTGYAHQTPSIWILSDDNHNLPVKLLYAGCK